MSPQFPVIFKHIAFQPARLHTNNAAGTDKTFLKILRLQPEIYWKMVISNDLRAI